MEIIKRNPEDFGGFQDVVLTPEERVARYCAVAGCASSGYTQIGMPKYKSDSSQQPVSTYRLVCRLHVVLMTILIDSFYGDPSPLTEARKMAQHVGLDFVMLIDEASARPGGDEGLGLFNPAYARCVNCGGAFIGEKQGMYTGTRYVHTCGVTAAEARGSA